jgi:hypothetical protein
MMKRKHMCGLNLMKQMEPCKLRLEGLGMMRQNPVGLLRGLESRRQARKRVQLLQILQALKLSLIFPLLDLGDVLGEN